MATQDTTDTKSSRAARIHVCSSPEPCVACLGASELAAAMSPDQVDALFRIAKPRRLSKGEVLIAEGGSGGPLFVVARGELDIARDSAGTGVSLARLGPGAMAGQLTFVDGLKRTATVTASADGTWVFAIERGDIEAMLKTDPLLVYRAMQAILRSATTTVDEMNRGFTESIRYIRG